MKFKNLQPNKKLILLYILVSIIPFVLTISSIYFGKIAFWYDPARDFLLALKNLENPTFIGQPSGLPGLFYGPYWIWIISVLTLISKDPRIVVFFLLTIPYFTVFPFILYKISKSWGLFISIVMWLLFILNFGSYANQIWNVHYAALCLIGAIYLFINPENKKNRISLIYISLGFLVGLVTNFHLSFGIPTTVAFIASVIVVHLFEYRKKFIESFGLLFKKTFLLIFGTGLSFVSFLLFEIRHSFIQSKTFIKALTNSVVYNTASVGQTGMTDRDIVTNFLGKFSDLIGAPSYYSVLIFSITVILILLLLLREKITFKKFEIRLIILIFTISFFLILSFVVNENPIWAYYFIGVEVLFLLFIGLLLSKISYGKYVIILSIVLAFFSRGEDVQKILEKNNYTNSDLGTRSYVVESIFMDAERDFQYASYSSAIYTYEYDYLFKWKDEKFNKNIIQESDLVYVIIPKTSKETEEDFKNYKTPKKDFNLIRSWEVPDGTHVYKMIKK